MNEFREGWYEISFDAKTYDKRCRYYKTTELCTAECIVKETGLQILLWAEEAGRPTRWTSDYRPIEPAPAGDWWDNDPGGKNYQPGLPGDHSRADRTLTARELCQRAASADPSKADALTCSKEIHVGLFFDGTNNNLIRDSRDRSHTNVVSLFNAHKSDEVENFRYYMPGVGTHFPEIGEDKESDDGKRFGSGGEARIHWALIQVYNALHRAHYASDLVQPDEMKELCVNQLKTWWRWGDSKMVSIFRDIQERLLKAIKDQRPRVTKLHLSVFGFSRGSAEARAFCQWVQMIAENMTIGEATLELHFLGIFDTVASVGLADSAPVGQGFQDWADGTMDIRGVNQTVHYVAAHEIRQSFPLSTARIGGKVYPTNTKEFVYPGAHSDLGGGYPAKSQGKGMGGRTSLLSQIPLMDMYFEALAAGVRLRSKAEMPNEVSTDFEVNPALDKAFSDYAAWTTEEERQNVAKGGEPVQNRMRYHMELYWRWRASKSDRKTFEAMSSFQESKPQDQQDLWESELDWLTDVKAARDASRPTQVFNARIGTFVEQPPTADEVQKRILRAVAEAKNVPQSANDFFDKYVHDSHGGFWMLGPITDENREDFIAGIKQKKATHDRLLKEAEEHGNPGRARNFRNHARAYELNNFERRVFEMDAKKPGTLPLMTDADAADLRDNAGTLATIALKIVGTGTRREPHGHGRYRRVFDKS
ncbi:T6SS phospholipase effector Tle1-like catalytic domain-containing protein [Variovorax sp. 38R]|uniref:T6SS phospholipase effector Tle1-like catalytic domain-containing protein n=1 Tax=Variovorax sp. 38R TaxID=2774875 RepID=UPI00177B80BD|nr:DUF2235 domain-containing protein [Variovorax sp. 38R]QOF78355.1 DUF2235 domain-containing protein [Variovorax sp. 38R]